MTIIEQALSETAPKVLATLSKTIHFFFNRVLYRTVILSSPGSIHALHRTATTSPHLLSQVKKLVVSWDQSDNLLNAKLSEIIEACRSLQAIVLPTLTSSIPDLAAHHDLKELVTPVFEDDETTNHFKLLPRADTITRLRFTEPGECGWLSPCEMLARFGNPRNLSHIQFSRRTGANEQNDLVFAEEVASILLSYPKLRLVVVSVFKGYAWSSDVSAVEDSHVWKILLDLKELDDRVVLVEGHRREWKKEYEDFHPEDSIDSRFWARFDD
ncbi:hypothetical protein EST38_g6645 [Candolleomyces aberdarensis]|uniref:Uncharacterized protein n=1 Tax=Candolleomyces aberdarensis TaxID=2316362 RepID=A0A4Q2DKG8_9AGAR|nr:hypothetical protein EST38_g6645 [Candolleomyces aberdarensis]